MQRDIKEPAGVKKINFLLGAHDNFKLNFTTEIDHTATTNVISYGMWLLLDKPALYEIQVKVLISGGIEVLSLGVVETTLKLESQEVTDIFLVVDSRKMSTHLTLSKKWAKIFEEESKHPNSGHHDK